MTKDQLLRLKEILEYDLTYTEDQHGYDRDTYFADRQWTSIENELQELIKAVEKDIANCDAKVTR